MARTSFLSLMSAAFALLAMAIFSGCKPPEGSPEDGRRWYSMHNCNACHGELTEKGGSIEILPLTMSYASFLKRLREQDSPIMPTYSPEKISDKDAADIYLFLKNASN